MRIAPAYGGPVVHVLDASRAVAVASSLLSDGLRPAFVAEARAAQERLRKEHESTGRRGASGRSPRRGDAAVRLEWPAPPPRPSFLGIRELRRRTRWRSWSPGSTGRRSSRPGSSRGSTRPSSTIPRPGRRPGSCIGGRARGCWSDIVREPAARGARGGRVLPRRAAAGRRHRALHRRQPPGGPRRHPHPAAADGQGGRDAPTCALADFVAPADAAPDYLGLFAVTTGHGLDAIVAAREAAHDDYGAILAKALADRLAEAFAERLHERVRTELWGYAPDEALDNDGAHPGAVPGHPPGARLPGLPGAHREADHLRAAGGGAGARASRSPRASRCCRPPR